MKPEQFTQDPTQFTWTNVDGFYESVTGLCTPRSIPTDPDGTPARYIFGSLDHAGTETVVLWGLKKKTISCVIDRYKGPGGWSLLIPVHAALDGAS